MGRDKASIRLPDGRTMAQRMGTLLAAVSRPSLEVGPGVSGLACVTDQWPGQGPLGGVATAWQELSHAQPAAVMVVACDLPFVPLAFLRLVAEACEEAVILPVIDGRDQPLLARYPAPVLARAEELLAAGRRRMSDLIDGVSVLRLPPGAWAGVAQPEDLADADSPEDLARLGIDLA
jgi:molybdopterin-guanine dinucleotide biosynthesis protein A